MGSVFTLIMFIAAFFGTLGSGVAMGYEVVRPVTDGTHFTVAAIAFLMNAALFMALRDDVDA